MTNRLFTVALSLVAIVGCSEMGPVSDATAMRASVTTSVVGVADSGWSADERALVRGLSPDGLLEAKVVRVEYGVSVQGRPLALYRVQRDDVSPAGRRPAVLVMGVAQGGEYLPVVDTLPSVLAATRIAGTDTRSGEPRDLRGVRSFLRAGGVVYVAPLVNPDGHAAGDYLNANGVNLNRDWADLSQPETLSLATYFETAASDIDLRLVVDYHIGIPRLLYPFADSREALSLAARVDHEAIHAFLPPRIRKPLTSVFVSIKELYDASPSCGAPSDCRFSPRCDDDWNCGCVYDEAWDGGRCIMEPFDALAIEREGTSNDYFHRRFGAIAFIYEASAEADAYNVEDHAVWWDRNLTYLTGGTVVGDAAAATDALSNDHRIDALAARAGDLVP